ncbi:MAG: hypothetical protein GY950_32660 [bacterium]|nr:hypothetical protein [bacterium]
MFCPECECEYIDSIRECMDCHVKLVNYLPEKNDDVLIEIRSYPGTGYGPIIRDLLIDNRIPARLLSGGFIPTERIMIPEHLAEEADRLIIEFDDAAAENAKNEDENEFVYEDNEKEDETIAHKILPYLKWALAGALFGMPKC